MKLFVVTWLMVMMSKARHKDIQSFSLQLQLERLDSCCASSMSPSIARFLIRVPATLHAHSCPSLRAAKLSNMYAMQRLAAQGRIPILGTRTAASSVSNKPGSQTLPHALQNIKEETGNSAADLAKTIAGNIHLPESVASKRLDFVSPSFLRTRTKVLIRMFPTSRSESPVL